ncbi:MAG: spore coat associated protein CotJA [Oscillospiraceae bacterium]
MYNNNYNKNTSRCRDMIVPVGEFPEHTPIGMAYVPFQQWEQPYPENKALEEGTIFPSLNLRFYGRKISD